MRNTGIFLAVSCCVLAFGAHAQRSLVVPVGYTQAEGESLSGTLKEGAIRMQNVYGPANFPASPITITEIRFRRDSSQSPFASGTALLSVSLSTSRRSFDNLSTTYSDNVGLDAVTVFDGQWSFSSPAPQNQGVVNPFDITLRLTTPFRYDPALGSLLVDLKVSASSNGPWVDNALSANDQSARVFGRSVDSITATDANSAADILQFLYELPDVQFNPPGQLFTNQISVTLVNHVGAGGIRYTIDGAAPSATSPSYAGPINLTAGASVRARVFLNTFPVSDEFQETYSRVYAFADDGVPFSWREQHYGPDFLTNPDAAADADSDLDGYTTREEYEQGTIPIDGSSKPEIVLAVRSVPKLTFTTVPGRSYRIERSPSLNPPDWQVLVPAVLATGASVEYVDADATEQSYYQIVLLP